MTSSESNRTKRSDRPKGDRSPLGDFSRSIGLALWAYNRGAIHVDRMKPEDLNKPMSHARRHSPSAIRLPPELVESLKMVAESEGEPEYQAMVRRWIEERLRQETSAAGRVL